MNKPKVLATYKPQMQREMEGLVNDVSDSSIEAGINYTMIILKALLKNKFKSNKKLHAYLDAITPEAMYQYYKKEQKTLAEEERQKELESYEPEPEPEPVKVPKGKLAVICITSFKGAIGAEHYYAKLHIIDNEEEITVDNAHNFGIYGDKHNIEKPITKALFEEFKKKDSGGWRHFERGMKTDRMRTPSDCVEHGIKLYKKLKLKYPLVSLLYGDEYDGQVKLTPEEIYGRDNK